MLRKLVRTLSLTLAVGVGAFGWTQSEPNQARQDLAESYLSAMKWRSIGPASMGGRIVRVRADERNPGTWYVGAASGGIWKTTDGGKTFEGLFQNEPVNSIGDVAVSQSDPNVVWVGTGEHNPRNSTIYGNGVYKSTDGGATWTHMGLEETRHIGRIAIDPKNPDIVYVGAMGRTWGPNAERGLFKTTDGGKSWRKILFVDEQTGVIEVQMHPKDSETLLVATWQRQRQIYDDGEPDTSHGPGSAVWRTADGGKTWKRLGSAEGLPGDEMGRTGIDFSRSDPNTVYLVTGAQRLPRDTHNGVWKSGDAGATWKRVNDIAPRPMYYSQIRVDPTDPATVYVLGTMLARSTDGGATFSNVQLRGIHVDHHAMWIDPSDPKHIVLGNDGGLHETHDSFGETASLKRMALGQFYDVAVDTRRAYSIAGGLQDNGTWYGPSMRRGPLGPDNSDFRSISGGDGFVVQIDPRDPDLVYSESQNGGLVRRYLGPRESAPTGPFRRPQPEGGRRENWAWKTDFLLDPSNPDVYYTAAEVVYRSTDKGSNLQPISPRLPLTERGAATAISVSPLDPEVIWVGTDDGALWITRDGGKNWSEIHAKVGLPLNCYVSTIEASRFEKGRCYVAFDAHRSNDDAPYFVATEDFGATWRSINANLPPFGSARCLREDTLNGGVLYCGTEFFAYVSIDRGSNWTKLNSNLPTVAVHDFAISDAADELVAATHGRSIWALEIGWLREASPSIMEAGAYLFGPTPAVLWDASKVPMRPVDQFVGENPESGAVLFYVLGSEQPSVEFTVADLDGRELARVPGSGRRGLNRAVWDLKSNGATVKPGMYSVILRAGGRTLRRTLFVEPDPEPAAPTNPQG